MNHGSYRIRQVHSENSVLHHEDDEQPDDYVSRPDMTVLGFGRRDKDKFLTGPQTFSIGFVETTNYNEASKIIEASAN